MRLKFASSVLSVAVFVCCFASYGLAASRYDRELIVEDKTRAMQVESVFKEMMAAYEDEDARLFLDHVSDERFRQDYITFTDALYNDFRNYEIHQVDYWIDRIVPDNVKQFLFVQWEKRYENLDDGRQLIQRGVSRFLFDEVDGEYLLIELAGNHLFGGSLQEWREEVPVISGQEAVVSQDSGNSGSEDSGSGGDASGLVCDSDHLNLCDNAKDCGSVNGYWYNNMCNLMPALPDLVVQGISHDSGDLTFRVTNIGVGPSGACHVEWDDVASISMGGLRAYVDPLNPGESVTGMISGVSAAARLTVDIDDVVTESNESNNIDDYSL